MKFCRLPIGVVFFALAVFSQAAPSFGVDPRTLKPGNFYLLMDNGIVHHGDIKIQGQEITVQVDQSATFSVRARDVKHVGKDLLSLYDYQVRSTVFWETGDELNLGIWCVNNGLLDQAGKHYTVLKQKIPNRASFRQFENLLKERLIADPETRKAVGVESDVTQASHGEKVPHHPLAGIVALDIPPSAVAEFHENILPILRNRCGNAGCHGMQGPTELCFPPAKSHSYQLKQKSLESTLKFVDRNNPSKSRLLALATSVHGSQTAPGLDPGTKSSLPLLNRIVEWMESVSNNPNAQTANSMRRAENGIANENPTASFGSNTGGVGIRQPSEGSGPTRAPVLIAPDQSEQYELESGEIRSLEEKIRRLEQIEKARDAKDPFDPEAFNAMNSSKTTVPAPATRGK